MRIADKAICPCEELPLHVLQRFRATSLLESTKKILPDTGNSLLCFVNLRIVSLKENNEDKTFFYNYLFDIFNSIL